VLALAALPGCWPAARPPNGAFGHPPPPERAYAAYLRGRRAALEGRHDQAVRFFADAVATVPDDLSLRVALTEELLVLGHLDDAQAQIDEMLKRWPHEPDAWLMRGRLRARKGDTSGAAAAYEQAMALEPDGERAYLLAGGAREKLHQPGQALADYQALLARWPDSVAGHYHLGLLAESQKDLATAEQHLARAVELAPDDVDARVRLARIYQKTGRAEKARATLRDAFDRSGEDPWVGEQLFRVTLEVGDRDGALELLATLDADWRDPDARVAIGNLYLELHHPEEALVIARAVLAKSATHHGARLLAARALAQKHDVDGAVADCDRVPPEAPEWPEAQALAAEELSRKGDHEAARARLDKALERMPDSVPLIIQLAAVDERAGDVPAARATLEAGQKRRPGDHDLIFARASLEDREGDPDKAVAIMQTEILADDPDSIMALNFIGYSYASRGIKLDEAERLLSRAIELEPDDGYLLDSWGVLLYQRGKYDDAQAALDRADRLAPDEPEILLHLGELSLRRGDRRRANELWTRALALDPDDATRKRLEDRVQTLSKTK
jgi:tetratricopeptide (TPR) repeat protein